jgi:type II secretory ATPase GspE/PulE/Tfp pilus assembly ATPase PilB-like protein
MPNDLSAPVAAPVNLDGLRFIKTNRGDDKAVALLNGLFEEAAGEGISDVHFETRDDARMRVRVRNNGVLAERTVVEPQEAKFIEDKIRMMTKMTLNERDSPQDGRFSLFVAGRFIDVRTSLVPTRDGCSIVCRLLDQRNAVRRLDDMQLPDAVRQAYAEAITRSEGLILLTGPTGSGKTSTLYACLNELNTMERKIVTIEDPVEYRLPLAQQFEVSEQRPFAKLLRSSLRQDPEVVLVGEIRDAETAGIAVQASLTGHLVLSTLHTNDAAGAAVRMTDLGVDAYTLGTSILALVSQRLVSKLCPHCARPYALEEVERERLQRMGYDRDWRFHERHPDGCDQCRGRGIVGRMPVVEMIVGSSAVRAAIEHGAKRDIEAEARKQPQFRPLVFAGLDACADGRAPFREVMLLGAIESEAEE